ncbi:GTP 3',8-cyclase 2 [Frankliniella fusca]|uniref:GTP 3',8-cyclase 2 n=1 Tax=Frankliniella fusca TaxID=407009 RepID=A0AAE1GUV8_9NEOP|nr:GTP 3',8-cyclase 2 [Frankliniella fusca]
MENLWGGSRLFVAATGSAAPQCRRLCCSRKYLFGLFQLVCGTSIEMSSNDIFEDVRPSLAAAPSPTSLGSTPMDFSGVDGEHVPGFSDAPQEPITAGFLCSECKKILKTKSGYTRHMTSHKINGYNFRKPMEDEIRIRLALPDMFQVVLSDISNKEPAVGEWGLKKKNICELIVGAGSNAASFLESVSAPLLEIVLTKNKIMPSAQYEDMLTKVNHLLHQESCEKILLCMPQEQRNVSKVVLERLVWRIISNLSLKMQEVIFHKMKKTHQAIHASFSMSDSDIIAYKEHVGKILRTLYRFGQKCENSVWSLRCQCLREKFVVREGGECEVGVVTSAEFINASLWQEGSISLSDPCSNLFLGLEKVVQYVQNNNLPCTAEIIYENLTTPENLIVLNDLRHLSQGILSEELALNFLHELIKSVVTLSSRWDAKRKRDIASIKQKTMNVATRSDLKRNPKKRVEPPSASAPTCSTSQQKESLSNLKNQASGSKTCAKKTAPTKANVPQTPSPNPLPAATTVQRKSSRVKKSVKQ